MMYAKNLAPVLMSHTRIMIELISTLMYMMTFAQKR